MNLKYILTASAMTLIPSAMIADQLVILHTNDTHSQLDPTDKNLGGILRRKALVDSVRSAEPGNATYRLRRCRARHPLLYII